MKKKWIRGCPIPIHVLKKAFLIMRLTFLLTVMFSLSTWATSVAQESMVTLQMKDASLEQVILELREQTGMRFFYSIDKIKSFNHVSIQAKGEKLADVLNRLLEGTGLTYTLLDDVVVIKDAVLNQKKDSVKNTTVKGVVRDVKKQPIPGVTVLVKGTTIGVTTDADGKFSLFVPSATSELMFSFVGMKTITLKCSERPKQGDWVITMEDDVIAMDEVNVVSTGYQTVNRRDMVGSFSQVKAEDIMVAGAVNITDMLQGQIPGMIVTRTSARAGSRANIKIRGTATLGNTDPIFVVDGIIQEDPIRLNASSGQIDDIENIIGDQVSWLNPDDIATITVLKDASATAIYGSRASNGVIVITTKKPKSGDRISVRYSGSFSFTPRLRYDQFNLMNSQERVMFAEEAFSAGALYSQTPIPDMNTPEGVMRLFFLGKISEEEYWSRRDYLETLNTDWLELLTRRALTHTHNVSFGGGSERATYSASIGYSKQEGQEVGNDTEKFTSRVALNMRLHDKIRMAINLDGTVGKTTGYANGVNPLQYATTTSRAIPAFDENGEYAYYLKRSTYKYNGENEYLSYNILNEMDNSRSTIKSGRVGVTLDFSWELTSWLKYQLTGGYSYNSVNTDKYSTERTFYIANAYRGYDYGTVTSTNPWYAAAQLPAGGELFSSIATQHSYNIQNKLIISRNFNENNRLNIMLGTEVRSSMNHSTQTTFWGYVPDRGHMFVQPTIPENVVPIASSYAVSGFGILNDLYNKRAAISKRTDNFFSLFATVAYSFMNRYVFNFNIRNDASNRFGQDVNRRFDPTYSFGLSWRMSEEPWMERFHNVISDLNFKVTYGIQGNANLNQSPDVIFMLSAIKQPYASYGSKIMSLPNPNLTWERTHSWDFGLDFQLFNRFNIVLDYYTRRSNAVIQQEIAYENGRKQMNINGGILHNNGIEVTVSFNPVNTEDFGINLSLNSSKNWNKGGESPFEPKYTDFLKGNSTSILKEGYPINAIWSWDFTGLNSENGAPEFANLDMDMETAIADPTTVLTYSGSTEPDFTGGLNFGVRYKSFTLNTSFTLLLGGVKRLPSPYRDFYLGVQLPDATVNIDRDVQKRWRKPGDEAYTNIPALLPGTTNVSIPFYSGATGNVMSMYAQSDELIVKNTFLRCRDLGISWRMPSSMTQKIGLNSFTASASVSNLFVIASKRFNGFDPELENSVMPKNYSLSISIGF